MSQNQWIWTQARDRLAAAVASLGYPEEFAGLLAGQRSSEALMEIGEPRSGKDGAAQPPFRRN